jgi:argininosuccinate synthase
MTDKVVLAYSGGLDTSIIIPWLKENYDCEVIAVVGDVGQGDDLEAVAAKALTTGASKVVVEDLRQAFIADYVWPTLRAGAIYEGKYLLGTSMARPIIARRQVEVALAEGAKYVAHGCTGKGNDQVRFELAYQALAPHLKVIAPWREWSINSREDAIDYAEQHGIPVEASRTKIYSRDCNLWHLSHEGGELEDANCPAPDHLWQLARSPKDAPDSDEEVQIAFERGTPVAVNGERPDPVALVHTLNRIGGRNAIGRVDLVENRFVGIKSRGCYETPGGTLLVAAHQELESLCLDRELLHFKEQLALKYAELVYFGLWFTPLRAALDAFVTASQATVTGTITLRLYKGNLSIAGRTSPYSLYQTGLAAFSMDGYNPKDAEGFIRILGLAARVQAQCAAALGRAPYEPVPDDSVPNEAPPREAAHA